MATYYTDATAAVASGNTSQYPVARVDGRGLVYKTFSITIGTGLANSDVIQLVKVPAGAVILDGAINSNGTQSGTDSTCRVGDGGDDDRFLTTTQGTFLRSGNVLSIRLCQQYTGTNYAYTDEDTIDLTVVAAGTGQTTGGIIKGYVLYAMNG